MRITEMSTYRNTLYDLQSNQEKVLDYQNQMSSGLTINKASDNPAGTVNVLRLKEILSENNIQKNNIDDGITWLNTSDSAISQLTDIVHRVHDLTVQSSNGTYSSDQRKATSAEIDQLLQQTVTIANSQINDHYIFGGTQTTKPPYIDNQNGTYTFQGSLGKINREIAPGTNEAINVSLDSVLSGPNGLFASLTTLKNDLNSPTSTSTNPLLSQLESNLNGLLAAQSDVGARTNRLQSSSDNIRSSIVNFTKLLSTVQDVDVADVYTKLNVAQNVYQSSLQTVAKIQQKSLLDFLR